MSKQTEGGLNLLLLWSPSVGLSLPQDQLLLEFSPLTLTPTCSAALKQRGSEQLWTELLNSSLSDTEVILWVSPLVETCNLRCLLNMEDIDPTQILRTGGYKTSFLFKQRNWDECGLNMGLMLSRWNQCRGNRYNTQLGMWAVEVGYREFHLAQCSSNQALLENLYWVCADHESGCYEIMKM